MHTLEQGTLKHGKTAMEAMLQHCRKVDGEPSKAVHTLFWMESARVSFCASSHSLVTTLSAVLLMGSRSSTCGDGIS